MKNSKSLSVTREEFVSFINGLSKSQNLKLIDEDSTLVIKELFKVLSNEYLLLTKEGRVGLKSDFIKYIDFEISFDEYNSLFNDTELLPELFDTLSREYEILKKV